MIMVIHKKASWLNRNTTLVAVGKTREARKIGKLHEQLLQETRRDPKTQRHKDRACRLANSAKHTKKQTTKRNSN